MIATLYIVILFIVLFIVITSLPVFGSLPKGLRLVTIKQQPNYKDGSLQNLSFTPMQPEGVSFFTILKEFLFGKHPNKSPINALPFIKPQLNTIAKETETEIIWFGHSSYLIKVNGYRILVDPVFSTTPSPFSFIGGKAFKGTDFVHAAEFENIDVLVITHDHYDHLDYPSILKISPKTSKILTSLGVGAHLEKWGISAEKITELSWNQSAELAPGLSFTSVPARHFTGRMFKRNQTLWSAFILQAADKKIFIGGDSGYDTHFSQIGQEYGPFDLAILECGQYNHYWPFIHMFPEQTVQAAIDLKASVLLPVHWGKFSLAMHPWNEPVERVVVAAKNLNQVIATPKLGETIVLDRHLPTEKWWNNY